MWTTYLQYFLLSKLHLPGAAAERMFRVVLEGRCDNVESDTSYVSVDLEQVQSNTTA